MYKKYPLTSSIILLSLILIAGLFGFTRSAKAVEFVQGGTIPAGQVIDDDVFIAGENVVVDGTVNGDLFAAGSTVTINGAVKGSLVVTGQTLFMNGTVDGSLYGASSAMTLGEAAHVGRNMYYGGFSLEAMPGSSVERDLLTAGYQAVLSGQVGRDVHVAVAALELKGSVGRDVVAEVGEPSMEFQNMPPFFLPPGAPASIKSGLRVSDEAVIGGKLTYTSPVEQAQAIQGQTGGVVYQTPQPDETPQAQPQPSPAVQAGGWFLSRLREIVNLLILGGLVIWLLPVWVNRTVEELRAQPLPSALWGFVCVIVGYVGAVILALLILAVVIFLGVVTLGSLAGSVFGLGFTSLGLVVTVFSLLVSFGSKLVVAFLSGKYILSRLFPNTTIHPAWPLVLGVVLYVLLRSIPYLGWAVGFVVTILGLGAIWLVWQDSRRPAALSVA